MAASVKRLSDIAIVPLSNTKFEELTSRSDVRKRAGATPALGDATSDTSTLTYAYTGKCDSFDLSIPEERHAYGQLIAKLYSGAEYNLLWEEKTTKPDGKLQVYIAYLQVIEVYQSGNDNFKLNEV